MNTWYSVSLGDGMIAASPGAEIESIFLRLFTDRGGPPDMAVFTRPESEGRLHCEVIAYFSPAAIEAAKLFDATPCEKPAPDGLSLLAGADQSWAVLFPGSVVKDIE
ncbi:MAG TPA: hypothetical protein VJ785_10925 [Anaerolineales bacterium]|nr:hypothetical protein [Anaerolineales bacterium]